MKSYNKYAVAGLCAVVLAGCTSLDAIHSVDAVRAMTPSVGGTFSSELSNQYRAYALHEADEAGEWDHAARFAKKAERASRNEAVGPFSVADWPVPTARVALLNTARARLMDHFENGARERMPARAAYAQVMFDCWLEEEAENDTDSRCQSEFAKTEPLLKTMMADKKAPTPMAVTVPGPYMVYFDFDSFVLSGAARRTIDDAVTAALKADVSRVVLIGHADRAGAVGYNMKLSRARVVATANALMEDGFPRGKIDKKYAGENSPQVVTPDGRREAKNRRVEIIFER